jgi:hypothetical protein
MRRLASGAFVCVALFAAHTVCAGEPAKTPVKAPEKKEAPKAPPPAPEVDEDFLEFLANWDSEDETWNEYLASLARDSKATDKDAGKTEPVRHPAKEGK